jgi:hypothetical protein
VRFLGVEQARSAYVDELRRVASSHDGAMFEPALRNADGELVREGHLFLPYRADLYLSSGKTMMVDTPSRVQFPAYQASFDAVQVAVAPFFWDYTKFLLAGVAVDSNWEPLQNWFERWFDPEDSNSANEEGLFGVVHCIIDPTPTDEGCEITVDFGSAQELAFAECIQALGSLGPRRLEVA